MRQSRHSKEVLDAQVILAQMNLQQDPKATIKGKVESYGFVDSVRAHFMDCMTPALSFPCRYALKAFCTSSSWCALNVQVALFQTCLVFLLLWF